MFLTCLLVLVLELQTRDLLWTERITSLGIGEGIHLHEGAEKLYRSSSVANRECVASIRADFFDSSVGVE